MSNQKYSSTKSRGRLPFEIQQRLSRDLEASETCDLTCQHLCNYRPNIYGSPKSALCLAIQNKFQWYKKLKKENIKQYWSLYAHSNNLQDKQVEMNKEKEFNKLDSELYIESKEEEEEGKDKEEKV